MKQALLWMFVCLTMSGVLSAQTDPAQRTVTHDSTERMFLPRDTFWGYGQFDLAPPHTRLIRICAGRTRESLAESTIRATRSRAT